VVESPDPEKGFSLAFRRIVQLIGVESFTASPKINRSLQQFHHPFRVSDANTPVLQHFVAGGPFSLKLLGLFCLILAMNLRAPFRSLLDYRFAVRVLIT
jgi:hypothetical protein